eukprot:scaffold9304_cov83-Cyclotella_meneghiniana.AAC.1
MQVNMHSGMIGLITKEPNKVDVTRNGEKQQSISEWIRVVQTRGQRSRRICRELSGNTTIKVSST